MSQEIVVFNASLLALVLFGYTVLALHLLRKEENTRQWVRSKWWLKPNFISWSRFGVMVLSWTIYLMAVYLWKTTQIVQLNLMFFAAFAFVIAATMDSLDGIVAKWFDLITKTGKRLDPILDKVCSLPPLLYFSWGNDWRILCFAILASFDLIGEFRVRPWIKRLEDDGKKVETGSNGWGRTKTPIYFITAVICMMDPAMPLIDLLFPVCVILGVVSCVSKIMRVFKALKWGALSGINLPSDAFIMFIGYLMGKMYRWE